MYDFANSKSVYSFNLWGVHVNLSFGIASAKKLFVNFKFDDGKFLDNEQIHIELTKKPKCHYSIDEDASMSICIIILPPAVPKLKPNIPAYSAGRPQVNQEEFNFKKNSDIPKKKSSF